MISDLIPLPPSILQDLSVYITQSQGYVKSRLLCMHALFFRSFVLAIYFSCHPPQNDEEYAPYIQELQQGLGVNLSNEINILKDIYLHIQEDEEKRTKAMAEFLGISMETDIKEMEEDPAENEKDSMTVEESEQRKEEKQKEKIYVCYETTRWWLVEERHSTLFEHPDLPLRLHRPPKELIEDE